MTYTLILLLEFYPSWLSLTRAERREYADDIYRIIDDYDGQVKVRFFDAEALPGNHYTDFCICETEDLQAYHFMWEKIRDSAAYAHGFFKIKDVIMGIENAYQLFEEQERQKNQ
ncbi:Darcynin, protein of unknown function [Seinonella peptonophila]|uniref:Darcynin 2 n=1 Tax=Seinonella peptonophila TaxID=112248 RepID=A0A1M4V2B5_9BACL|nr:darcynin family protein [Seinonella peptonophila]SHE63027.1 Darcynin, protein of unknown function [Seinonella peptonophila]